MSLHDSPFAMEESKQILQLQDKLRFLQDIVNSLDDETEIDEDFSIDFLHTLYALIEKQLVIITRLKLSDEAVDKLMLEGLSLDAQEEGLEPGEDLYTYLIRRRQDVRKKIIELTGEDLDEPVDLS